MEFPETFYNDVNDWLLVGGDVSLAGDLTGCDEVKAIDHLMGRGVTHVIDARREWTDLDLWADCGLPVKNYAHLPIVDQRGHCPAEWWFAGVEDFVADFLVNRNEGDVLYAHCHMGINRGPSAAMLALLTADPETDPWDAFLTIRAARDISKLVYAEAVGMRHIVRSHADDDDAAWTALDEFRTKLRDYWTGDLLGEVNREISYYRSQEGGTLVVDTSGQT